MTKPFIITSENRNTHTVSWPTFNDIRQADTKIKLLEVLFKELNNDEVGLVIKFSHDDLNIMWIKDDAWASMPDIDRYMHDHYEIIGVGFKSLSSAETFQTYLEKKYMWHILHE